MPVALDQFVKQLEDSGILTGETLKDFVPPNASPKDAEELARELVRQKKLTKFQAEEAYKGKAKSLVLGNYVLMEKIGAGGMGQVFKARHRRMDRLVAVKLLPPAMTKDKAAIARFDREVKAAARLRHTNIVAADDADEANGIHFLVMECVDGSDLSALVKKNGPLPVDQAVDFILQAARGLEYAHSEGVIHRDIKPANLLLDKKGVVKILDMGLARIDAGNDVAAQAELTGTGMVMGTVDYMAPEQALNTKTADARADIYSLGISLWYLLTGKCVYAGDSLMAKLLAHRDEPVPSLSAAVPSVPDSVDGVFRKMIAKQAKDRYQTMAEVIRDLEATRSGSSMAVSVTMPSEVEDNPLFSFLSSFDADPSTSKTVARTRLVALTSAGAAADATLITGAVVQTTDPQTKTFAGSGEGRQGPKKSQTKRKASPPSWWQDRRVLIGGGAAALLILLSTIFLFQTPNGTLRVEILDPEVEVKVQGTTVTLNQANTEPIFLKAGEKKLLVTRGDLSFETESFTLKKGTETTVKVDLVDEMLIASSGGKVLGEKSVGRMSITASTTGNKERGTKAGDTSSNGRAMNIVSLGQPGQFALRFQEQSYVEIPTLRRDTTGPFTIELWIQSPEPQGVLVSMEGSAACQLQPEKSNNGATILSTLERTKSGDSSQNVSVTWEPRRQHIAWVLDDRDSVLFIDGREAGRKPRVAATGVTSMPGGNSSVTLLGSQRYGDSKGYHWCGGTFYGVRFSTVARYAKDFSPSENFEADKETLALYRFDEGQGDILHDSSGNNHHGKIVGAKWVTNDGRPVVTTTAPGGKPIDLLPLVNLNQDLLEGDWSKEDPAFVSRKSATNSVLRLPVEPGDEYTLSAAFESQRGNVSFVLPFEGNGLEVFLSGERVELCVDRLNSPTNPRGTLPASVNDGRRHDVLLEVTRPTSNEVSLALSVDGKNAFAWKGTREQLRNIKGRYNHQPCLLAGIFLPTSNTFVRLLEARLTTARTTGEVIDVLARVDLARDTFKHPTCGEWTRDGSALISPGGGKSGRLVLPFPPPPEYELTAVVERMAGSDGIMFGAVVDGHHASVCFDTYIPHVSGISLIDRKPHPENESKFAEAVLNDFQRHTIQITVGKRSIRAKVDDRDIIRWEGDPNRLISPEVTNQAKNVWFGAAYHQFKFHKLELRPLSSSPNTAQAGNAAANVVYLDDLTEKSYVGFMQLGKHGTNVDPNRPKRSLGGVVPAHGLTMHPQGKPSLTAVAVYDLSGKYTRFDGIVARPDGTMRGNQTFVHLVGDGQLLWKSPTIDQPSPQASFHIDVTGVQELTLKVEAINDSNEAHILWVDPRLTLTVAPAFQQWMKDVQAMPADKQVEAVSKKLVDLNPDFDGKLTGQDGTSAPRIENGVVTELKFFTDNVTDISPLRAWPTLKHLLCNGSGTGKGTLSDLMPLAGCIRLESLSIKDTKVYRLRKRCSASSRNCTPSSPSPRNWSTSSMQT